MTIQNQPDNRKFTRVRYCVPCCCRKMRDGSDSEQRKLNPPLDFETSDISLAGMAVVGHDEIPEDAILHFDLIIDKNSFPVDCLVKYCLREDGVFRTGLEYIDPDKDLLRVLKSLVTKLSIMGKIVK